MSNRTTDREIERGFIQVNDNMTLPTLDQVAKLWAYIAPVLIVGGYWADGWRGANGAAVIIIAGWLIIRGTRKMNTSE